jgi:hypothetical protein
MPFVEMDLPELCSPVEAMVIAGSSDSSA